MTTYRYIAFHIIQLICNDKEHIYIPFDYITKLNKL